MWDYHQFQCLWRPGSDVEEWGGPMWAPQWMSMKAKGSWPPILHVAGLWGSGRVCGDGERSLLERRKHCSLQLISPEADGSVPQTSDFPREATHLNFSGEFLHLSSASSNMCVYACLYVTHSSPNLRMTFFSSKLKQGSSYLWNSGLHWIISSSFHTHFALCL